MAFMRTPTLLATTLLVALSLAGCSGGDGQDAGATPTDEPKEVTNAIEGRVQTEDLLPLEMVKMQILSLNLSIFTNSDGRYRFSNLEPRDYLVVAEKDGFRTLTQRAIVQDGKVHELDFVLEARPTAKPFHSTQDHNGRVSCNLVYGTDPESMEHYDCGSNDPNNDDDVEFQIDAGGAQIVVEAFWTPTTDAAKHLTMTVESVGFGHQDLVFSSIAGASGLRIAIPQTVVETYYPDGGGLRVRMEAGPSITGDEAGADAGAAIQQDFTLYVTTFFVEPGPPTFTARPS